MGGHGPTPHAAAHGAGVRGVHTAAAALANHRGAARDGGNAPGLLSTPWPMSPFIHTPDTPRHAARTIHRRGTHRSTQPPCWQLALSEYDAKAAEHGLICTCHPPRGHAPTAPAQDARLNSRGLFLVPLTDFLTSFAPQHTTGIVRRERQAA